MDISDLISRDRAREERENKEFCLVVAFAAALGLAALLNFIIFAISEHLRHGMSVTEVLGWMSFGVLVAFLTVLFTVGVLGVILTIVDRTRPSFSDLPKEIAQRLHTVYGVELAPETVKAAEKADGVYGFIGVVDGSFKAMGLQVDLGTGKLDLIEGVGEHARAVQPLQATSRHSPV